MMTQGCSSRKLTSCLANQVSRGERMSKSWNGAVTTGAMIKTKQFSSLQLLSGGGKLTIDVYNVSQKKREILIHAKREFNR